MLLRKYALLSVESQKKVFVSPETVSDRGSPPGSPGEVPGTPWIAVKFHSERTSAEVAGEVQTTSG